MSQLTKREQIAVAAMQAIISSNEGAKHYPAAFAELVAAAALQYTDALLEALAQITSEEVEDTHGD